MADVVDEIKNRLGIVELVSQYVQLKQAGRNFKGLCPFHSEKSPSFVVSPEKQICHCFGCNKGGDIFSFVQEVEGVDFVEALKFLAEKTGVKLEKDTLRKNVEVKSEKAEYYRAHELACAFFQNELHHTNDGAKVLSYLEKRGVNKEIIQEFRLGFAPDAYDRLHTHLLEKGVSKKILIDSGFVTQKNIASDQIFDKFRSRLMFPIYDYLGNICGFGGRALAKDQMPKYLNSPENIIYNKSKTLYGFFQSKKFIKELDQVIVVEGYFDCLLPFQAGVKNIVATSGVALTTDHVKQLKRLTSKVVTCFDADNAGFDATNRAHQLLSSQGMDHRATADFGGKDPADFVTEHGEAFGDVIKQAKDYAAFYLDTILKKYSADSFDGRQSIMRDFLPILKQMNGTARDHYVRELAKYLKLEPTVLYDEVNNFALPTDHPARSNQSGADVRSDKKYGFIDLIVGLVLIEPRLMSLAIEKSVEKYLDGDVKDIYNQLLYQYNQQGGNIEQWNFGSESNVLYLYCQEKYQNFSLDNLRLEMNVLLEGLSTLQRESRLRDLRREIETAEKDGDKEKLMELLVEQQKLFSEKV